MKIDLIVCLSSLLLYIIILIVFIFKIKKAKYNAAPKIVLKPSQQFYLVFVLSAILILLPLLIPLNTYALIAVCGCGVLGEYITLRDRLQDINKKD